MEKTLVILKPDAVKRSIIGEIINRFERAGLKIIGMKMMEPGEGHYHEHYEGISQLISRLGKEVYENTLALMTEGPVIALVLEGVEAVSHVRKMVGANVDPKQAAPGTIRGDYTHLTRDFANARKGTLPNIIHASGDAKEAQAEIALWFSPDELHEYSNVHESVVQGRVPKPKK